MAKHGSYVTSVGILACLCVIDPFIFSLDAQVSKVNDLDSLYNGICCRPCSAESRTENFISIEHSVAEI